MRRWIMRRLGYTRGPSRSMSSEAEILLFSDSPADLATLEQTIRGAVNGRTISIAREEESARELLASRYFDTVFAHSREGALSSTYFLNDVWRQNPTSTRFLLANTLLDPDALVRCVLGAHQFISMPLEHDALTRALARAEAIKEFVRQDNIQSLVSRMRTLPSRPSLYIDVMRELRSSSASASTVGELVSKDLAISTKLIQVANSAFFGQDQQVSAPAGAVLLLGLEMTSALVLSIEAFARFDKVKPLYFSIDRVWKHSQSVAEIARTVARIVSGDAEVSGQAYTAGLLHDIGKLALAQNFEEDYQRALKKAADQKVPIYEIEREIFGATHTETGAYLLAVWGLPLPIVQAVADHHRAPSDLGTTFTASAALHLAEHLAATPERFDALIAEYPSEFGLLNHVDPLRAALRLPPAPKAPSVDPQPAMTGTETPGATLTAPQDPEERSSKLFYAAVALVGLVALAVVAYSFLKPRAPKENSAIKETAALVQAAPEKDVLPAREPLPVPAVPAIPMVAAPPVPLKLQAIMYNRDRSSLVINGQLLHTGESIEGWRVVSITDREAVLASGTNRRTLELK